jgi:hypothetical protein
MMANGPVRYYYNPAFRFKIILFAVAVLFQFALQTWAARRDQPGEVRPFWIKAGAIVSLILWFSIGVAGRAIGYV